MILAQFFNDLGKKGGVSAELMEQINANKALATVDIPDAFAETIQSSLMNEEQARFNPSLKNHFQGIFHKSLSKKLEPLANEIDDEDFKRSFVENQNNWERLPNLFKKMKELEEAKVKAASSGKSKDVEEYKRQYDEVVNLRKTEAENYQKQMREQENSFNGRLMDMNLNSTLSSYKYIDELPSDVAPIVAREKINAKLKEKGASLAFDASSNSLRLMSATDPTLEYRENHNPISFKDFSDRVLAESKLLKINNGSGNPPVRPAAPPAQPQGNPNQPQRDTSRNQQLLNDMMSATSQ
jgi:hypothetical protein